MTEGINNIVIHERFNYLENILDNVLGEIINIAENAAIGNLDIKIDSSGYHGRWIVLFDGLNDLVMAVAEPK